MPEILPLPGDVVWIRRERWRVERATRDRSVVRLEVVWRQRRRTFLAPFDHACADRRTKRMRVRSQEALARLAVTIARTADQRLPLSLLDADATILPHQLEPALAIVAGRTRLLLADEVGLGKTIQAGLIIAELLRRQPAPRILVLVPASLGDQWQRELVDRLGVECLRADRRHLDALSLEGAFGSNPWNRSGVWLASPDFVKQAPVLASLPVAPWDLLVIDEAHTVCGDSDRYIACHALALRSRRVVLLSATPHSGDAGRFARLASLGGHRGAENPVAFRRTRAGLGLPATRRVHWNMVGLRDAEARVLSELILFERATLSAAGTQHGDGARLLLSVFRKRALSTFTALSRSLARRLLWLGAEDAGNTVGEGWTQASLAFDESPDDEAADELAGLTATTGLDADRERRWLRRLRQCADDAARSESKIARLQSLLDRTTEPVVVFSEFRDSLEAVESRLRRSRVVALLHGGQDLTEQREQLRRYLTGPASVLLATDVAGQGLNLQSRGRWVISLELPWNPARLEQRIGRVDRLGQTRRPHLTLLVGRHAAERGLLAHLARRVLSAQRSFSEDLLRGIVPPEHEVRDALFAQTDRHRDSAAMKPPELGIAAPVPTPALKLSRHWRRTAVVAARSLSRRRRLARCWRGPWSDADGIVTATLKPRRTPILPRIPSGPPTASCLVVCSAPVLNADDELVERYLVALTMPAALMRRETEELTARIQRLVHARLLPRLARLSRRVGTAAVRLAARERDVAEHARTEGSSAETQPGLFDAREFKAQIERLADAKELESLCAEQTATLEHASMLRLGEVAIEFMLESPRDRKRRR